ncbi:2Fe-2S iron-sulfur cluster binding domain-containing protein [Jiella sp. 40Bstr34]|uniref:2Fe-2S iron-sulfur cluster binding domain-containing protein n=1 Tax=Jiella pacifica TaxID=2696469 RepID=A0A6N9T443_9HYPH|nr:2Fe-2S iron-sulfur cluster binding domain-containing protein [Jiella pacifica]
MMPAPDAEITLSVNGIAHRIAVPATAPLLTVLRNDLQLNGPKYGCGLGQCGACTVLIDGMAARACTIPAGSVAGRDILTLEGLAKEDRLDPVQEAFVAEQAAQCGYCLNGMIMALKALTLRNPAPDEETIREALRYNLCRCGTHLEILAAARRVCGLVPGGRPHGIHTGEQTASRQQLPMRISDGAGHELEAPASTLRHSLGPSLRNPHVSDRPHGETGTDRCHR